MSEWEQIVRQNTRSVFRIAFRTLGSVDDAEDVVQDVFCEALELRCAARVTDWPGMLRRMAALRSIDRLRRTRTTVPLDEATCVAAASDEIAASELAERLRTAIGQLADQQAAVFSLTYFEQLTREEIAASLNISPTAVSTALYKARQKLKSLLFAETTQEK